MRKHLRLLWLAPAAALALAAQTPIIPAQDAYHYKYWANTPGIDAYTEWWYFNLYDTQQNVQAVLVYFVADPGNLTGHGLAPMLSVAYTPQGITTNADLYAASAFSAAYGQVNVTLGANQLVALDANTYHLTGASLNHTISWDLTFVRQAQSFQGFSRAALGPKPWEMMSWLAYMPSSHVTGQLTVNGQTYTVDTTGYHDHNWGEWIPRDILWNWAQYSQPGFWFDIYDIIGANNGTAHVSIAGQPLEFTYGQYQLVNTQWAYDPVNHIQYPVQTTFSANNGSIKVDLTMNVIANDPLSFGLPYPIPEYLIYEQTANYSGSVSGYNAATGMWQVLFSFNGNGFKEYTAARP
jgi:hypothetical protein